MLLCFFIFASTQIKKYFRHKYLLVVSHFGCLVDSTRTDLLHHLSDNAIQLLDRTSPNVFEVINHNESRADHQRIGQKDFEIVRSSAAVIDL